MAYETPITIKKAIDNIKRKKYLLPSIQREFVWDTWQIERLFDSLMRDYPISTFLFWKLSKEKTTDFQFYEFLRNYHEKNNRHNTKADLLGDEDIIALLDGQQRMTSLYIALAGSIAEKALYYRWDSPHAFPEKKMYLDLLAESEDADLKYDFRFLTDKELKEDQNKEDVFWFEASKIMSMVDSPSVMQYAIQHDLMNTAKYTKEQSSFALDTLSKFQNVIHQKGTISFYLEESEELDKVLQIFIRINSGGTKLSYSDLLLSIATAQWEEKDAREVIHQFVDEINSIGDGFKFNKDFVLKSCLVLADIKDIKFKVDNFTKANMAIIENKWNGISESIKRAVELVSKLGYSRDNLPATNTVIPIAYFIYKNEFENTILHSQSRQQDRFQIKEWLARVLIKGTFGGQPDSIYPVMRKLINEHLGSFPLEEIINYYKGRRKSISFTEDDIESILELNYGKAQTFSALVLLYPSLNWNFKYHQDHIHPKSFFSTRKLNKLGFTDTEEIQEFQSRFNTLPNLQLLQANENTEKNNKPFESWLNEIYPNAEDKRTFILQHHIPTDTSLKLEDFMRFFEARRTALKTKLMRELKVS
ncbi:DUF262 domain-containing protein [Nonlabens tegetincola]|uniref:DUF262 domain-containing protein n=1 Tax=Nonlabens tegetincola TaxID=323273 RepID=UPI000CF4A974|nr:DUF262 domain-containing protein [Nonlabens tegetincola]PQJ18442.1 hypothetical protein BST93_08120 [Nonlabens tegetincola]